MIKKILSLGGATAHRRSASTIGAFSSKDGNAKEDVDLKNECRFSVGISRITGCAYYLLRRRKSTLALRMRAAWSTKWKLVCRWFTQILMILRYFAEDSKA